VEFFFLIATVNPAFLRVLLACVRFFEVTFGTFGKG